MSEYQAIYKCRLCGEEIQGGKINREEDFDIKLYKEMKHTCKNGSIGIVEFVGFLRI